jgi:glycosyltransferase involved in cell wall biosynthesis
MSANPVRWYVAVPWLRESSDSWRLTRFVPNEDRALDFQVIPANYSLDRSRKITSVGAWREFMGHGGNAWRAVNRTPGPCGVITAFPQLPIAVALRKRLGRSNVPLVAWTFNLGQLYPGVRRLLSRAVLGAVDRFIVHSRAEIAAYSDWLGVSQERFQFVPFETPTRQIEFAEDTSDPFILSMGSAQRDYRLLFGVLSELRYAAVVVAAPHAVAGLSVPPNVKLLSGLTAQQCFELTQRARFNVIPVANQTTASGQVTLLDAMMFARPVIITSCPASVDYVTHGKDALLVQHGDPTDMKVAMQRMWEDETLRHDIGAAARRTAVEAFSEDVVGGVMGQILRDVGSSR